VRNSGIFERIAAAIPAAGRRFSSAQRTIRETHASESNGRPELRGRIFGIELLESRNRKRWSTSESEKLFVPASTTNYLPKHGLRNLVPTIAFTQTSIARPIDNNGQLKGNLSSCQRATPIFESISTRRHTHLMDDDHFYNGRAPRDRLRNQGFRRAGLPQKHSQNRRHVTWTPPDCRR